MQYSKSIHPLKYKMSRFNFVIIFLFLLRFIAPSKLISNKAERVDFYLRLILQNAKSIVKNCQLCFSGVKLHYMLEN